MFPHAQSPLSPCVRTFPLLTARSDAQRGKAGLGLGEAEGRRTHVSRGANGWHENATGSDTAKPLSPALLRHCPDPLFLLFVLLFGLGRAECVKPLREKIDCDLV